MTPSVPLFSETVPVLKVVPMPTIDLSAAETAQLGTERNGIPFMPDRASWDRFRAVLLAKSAQRNPGFFDPDLAAYTPGETEALLQHPRIQAWFEGLQRFEVPADYEGIVLVPCAASKPWRHHANARKSKLYTAYNALIDGIDAGTLPRLYFMTVSEPCGIVPQDRWNDFPPYDNPVFSRTISCAPGWSRPSGPERSWARATGCPSTTTPTSVASTLWAT